MEDTLIGFETAKLAKLRGFDELCSYYFENDGKAKGYKCSGDFRNSGWRPEVIRYMRPTQSLLQKYLRDKHNINVLISYQPDKIVSKTYYWYVIVDNNIEHDDWQERFNNILEKSYQKLEDNDNGKNDILFEKYLFEDKFAFDTYEECLEYALQQALNLI